MKPVRNGAIALLLYTFTATSQVVEPGEASALSDAAKPPWQWTIEERLRVRFDAEQIGLRVRAHRRDVASGDGTREVLPTSTNSEEFVIEGQRNPELFLPHELLSVLLRGVDTDPGARDRFRAAFAEDIREFGWDDKSFWREFERLTVDAAPDLHHRGGRPKQAADNTESVPDRCRARRAVLVAARAHFGDEFDRFLYEVVAPTLNIAMRHVPENEPLQLKQLEEGCP